MKKQMHLAGQYLAAAGISFLEKKDDDSHTNLGFNTETGNLETHLLSENNDQLLLSYENFSLIWKSNTGNKTFKLDGASHKEVTAWIDKTSQAALGKTYNYKFHYDLPYSIDDSYVFKLVDVSELKDLMHLRMLTEFNLEKINKEFNLSTDIRVWPHHFDTGIYTALPDSSVSVGLGLAIPDSVCSEYYLYASGYTKDGQIEPVDFKKLSKGTWRTDGFKGAVLPATTITEDEALTFFKETINQFKSH